MKANLPSREIETRLRAVRRRIRKVQARRGAFIVITAAVGGLLAIMAADFFFSPLHTALRWGLFAAWIAGVIAAAKYGLGPLFRKVSLVQIARWIEIRHPEMQERLSTVLELSANRGGVSPELLEELGRAAGEDIGKVDPELEVKTARTKGRWSRPAAAVALALLVPLAIWPRETSRLLVRAVAPFSKIGNAGAVDFVIHPGNIEVIEGDRVEIGVAYDGPEKAVSLRMKLDDGAEISQALAEEEGTYRYILDPARQSFEYRAAAGRAESDRFKVTIWPLPALLDPRVTLDFHDYTGLLPREQPLDRAIEAVEGTAVTLSGRINTAIGEAWLEIDGKRAVEGKVGNTATGGTVEFAWTLANGGSGEGRAMFRHRLGREIEAARFTVNVLPDKAPEVLLLSPSQKELRVRPDEVLSLRYEVSEDFALASTAIEVAAGKKSAVLPQILPPRVGTAIPPLFRGTAPVAIGELRSRFPESREMRLRVNASDTRPAGLGGPGVGHSEWLTIRIDQNAESLARQELRAEHDGARETIEKALQAAREARDRMDSVREEVKKESLNEHGARQVQESGEKLAKAEETTATLAKEMAESVHAAKADEVAEAAKDLQQAREKLENAPLQDTAQAREATLNEAKEKANEAIKELEQVREQMDRDREKVQDLARMQELAQQQQELARQAMENLETPPKSEQALQEWQNQQRQMNEAIKQQLRERPDARAEALRQQAEQAKEMAADAREMANAQKSLEQQAAQAAQPDPAGLKEQLQQALAKEQAAIAAEAKEELAAARESRAEAADILPEASAAAQTAAEQLQQNQPQAAAEAAEKAADSLQQAAESAATPEPDTADPSAPEPQAASPEAGSPAAEAARAEALGNLADRQEELAGAMEALAKGDLAEALKGLQAAQAEAAAELAEAIREAPAIDNTGHMNEAANTAKQGSEQAAAAEKQGEAGQQPQAAQQHAQSAGNFQKSAEALDRAAQEFSNWAEQTAAQPANPNKAAIPAGDLAEAFEQSGEAAAAEGAAAAQAAAEAAAALSRAAQAGRASMQGLPQPGQPGPPGAPAMPGPPGPMGQPGEQASQDMEGLQQRGADPGLPPELAKLGISAADWEKIQTSLASDVGAGGADSVPAEYKGLVKGYFESMSKTKK